MCADQKKRRDKGKNKGKNKSMSWIIQWPGCTPKVAALWPLWQEVKGSAVAAGINGADMFRSAPQSVCEWQRKLTQDVKLYEHILNSEFIYGQNTHWYHALPAVCLDSTCINCCSPLRVETWPLNPDTQNESFSLLFQQHVLSYYKIHVWARTMYLIFHTREDKVNMQESEDRYQTRRVIANWVMFGYTLHAL